jgi:hypothetical protein
MQPKIMKESILDPRAKREDDFESGNENDLQALGRHAITLLDHTKARQELPFKF